jgi:hypothetical protein
MGIVGVSAEIRTGNLSNTSQKSYHLKLSLGDMTQKSDAINKRIGLCVPRHLNFMPAINAQHGDSPTCTSILQFDAINKRALRDRHVSASVLKSETINKRRPYG